MRKLDRKLDKIHDHLAQASQMRRQTDSQPAFRPLLGRNITYKLPATYELTTTPARIAFRITIPYYIQLQPNEQIIAIRAPQRYDATSRWHDARGKIITTVTHAHDYAKFIKIYGFHIIQLRGSHFHFRPTQAYQDSLVEERVYIDNGIKLRLTKQTTTKPIVFAKGAYLGNLHIVTPLQANIY